MQQYAEQHATILRKLAELDYAPAALEEAVERTRLIVLDVQATGKKLKDLRLKTQEEREEHLDLQQSLARKWAYKLTFRGDEFAEKAAKEEREYYEALRDEHVVQNAYEKLEADWAAARKDEEEMRRLCKERDGLELDLADIYAAVFDGPTPSFPQEDGLERAYREGQEASNRAQSRFLYERHVASLLEDALSLVVRSAESMAGALDDSVSDILGLGEHYTSSITGEAITPLVGKYDQKKAERLRFVRRSAGEIVALLAQARQYDPTIPDFEVMWTPEPDWWDMRADNPISDVMMHERIKDAQVIIEAYRVQLEPYVTPARERAGEYEKQASVAAEALDKARQALHSLRAGAFSIVIAGNA